MSKKDQLGILSLPIPSGFTKMKKVSVAEETLNTFPARALFSWSPEQQERGNMTRFFHSVRANMVLSDFLQNLN